LHQCGIDELEAEIEKAKPRLLICMVGLEEFYSHERTFASARGGTYVRWPIEDADLPALDRLEALVEFAAAFLRAGQPVLVHCAQGLNRSGLVVALLLRAVDGVSGKEAVRRIRRARPYALVNTRFKDYVEALP
jgi:protein-tyrosine phosphatase